MFTSLYRNGLWAFPILLVLATTAVTLSIRRLVKLGARNRLFAVPLVEQQEVRFPEAGRVVLCAEGPLFTSRFARLGFELVGEDGARIQGWPTLFHARSSTMSTVRMELRSFSLPRPGSYKLLVAKLGEPRADDSKHQIVFMRPHLAEALALVVALTLSACALIASLVLFIIRLMPATTEV
jgi:hypothetical protein